ncbi:iron donor protein CyaY [Pasteurellaceae bacterium RH1A]|nr:iron donor protein CyaY [Pasteurellaceae bacterium RH1A]
MTPVEFHQAVNEAWQTIEDALDEQGADIDCEVQGSVMTLVFPDRSQVVINKQEAMREMWLSSKLGAFHFVYRDGDWLGTKDQRPFSAYFREATEKHGEVVELA